MIVQTHTANGIQAQVHEGAQRCCVILVRLENGHQLGVRYFDNRQAAIDHAADCMGCGADSKETEVVRIREPAAKTVARIHPTDRTTSWGIFHISWTGFIALCFLYGGHWIIGGVFAFLAFIVLWNLIFGRD